MNSFTRFAILSVFLFALSLGAASLAKGEYAPPPQETPQPDMPSMMFPEDRFPAPPVVDNPTQADLGAHVYYQVCLVCHGDEGQGLNKAWREKLGPPDNNCWQSGCHQTTSIEEGTFAIPRSAPPVIFPGYLSRYDNAHQLYSYIKATMPWHNPGYLEDEEYWQLTAFLLRENGRDPGDFVLNEVSARSFRVDPNRQEQSPPEPALWPYLLFGGTLAAAGVIILLAWRRRRKQSGQNIP